MILFCVAVVTWATFSLSGYVNETGAPPYQGLTASGRYADADTLACGLAYPFGTRFLLPDGEVRTCHDRGSLVHDGALDLWFPSYADAIQFGRRTAEVGVVEGIKCGELGE